MARVLPRTMQLCGAKTWIDVRRRVFATASLVFIAAAAWARCIASDEGVTARWCAGLGNFNGCRCHSKCKLIDNSLLGEGFNAFRQTPGLVRELWTLQNGEGGLQAHTCRRLLIIDQVFQGGKGTPFEVRELLAQGFHRILSKFVEFRLEVLVRFKPIMNG